MGVIKDKDELEFVGLIDAALATVAVAVSNVDVEVDCAGVTRAGPEPEAAAAAAANRPLSRSILPPLPDLLVWVAAI